MRNRRATSSSVRRRRTSGTLLTAGLAISLAAAVTAPALPTGDPDRGRVVYDQYCIACHGDTGRGDGPAALGLSPRPASLVSASTSAKSDKDLLQIIAAGKPRTAMQAWNGTLTAEEQRDVLAYIRSLVRFTPSLPTPIPGTPRR